MGFQNGHIVAYAISSLGGASKKIPTEEIAAKCYEICPERFSWTLPQYKRWPDISVALLAIKTAKETKLVFGRQNRRFPKLDGWQLTKEGILWLKENEEDLLKQLIIKLNGPSPQRDVTAAIRQVRTSQAFKRFDKDGNLENVDEYAFRDMLKTRPDTPEEVLSERFTRIMAQIEASDQERLKRFLALCKDTFFKE
jgi:hypothetical protein